MQNEPILNSNQTIDQKYEVKFFLTDNGYWQKYRVKNKSGDNCFLKIVNSAKLSTEQFNRDRLLEVEIIALLNHGNIATLKDNGEVIIDKQKYHYIVTEFISGESLQEKLKRESTLSLISAETIIIDILNALKAMHNRQKAIIHNNINLDSIYIDCTGDSENAIVTDFDFARYISAKINQSSLKKINPFYIAPELYNGVFTPQSDIFAVGALFYHLIVGIPPWYTELSRYKASFDKLRDKINEKRSKPLEFGIHGFEEIEYEHTKKTIKKAVETNVDNRFQTADEFLQYLNRDVAIYTEQSSSKEPMQIGIKGKTGGGFDRIVGMDELKDILRNDVIRPLKEPERFEKYDIPLPNGMLLYGPPGCGKTFISERFAEEVGFNYIKVISSDLASIYIHGSQEKIGQLFKKAEENAPTILFFDEFDALVPDRQKTQHQGQASEVNEFLAQLDNCGERSIFVIAATNRPEIIDPAVLRSGRIDYKKYVPTPDFNARRGLFEKYLENRPIDLAVDYDKLAELTENYVSGDIKAITDFAARKAERKDMRISQSILVEIIQSRAPSVNKSQLESYNTYQESKDTDKPKFGFHL